MSRKGAAVAGGRLLGAFVDNFPVGTGVGDDVPVSGTNTGRNDGVYVVMTTMGALVGRLDGGGVVFFTVGMGVIGRLEGGSEGFAPRKEEGELALARKK